MAALILNLPAELIMIKIMTYSQDMPSYDYDAPVSEAGWAKVKYKALRDKFKKQVTYVVPEITVAIPVITILLIKLTSTYDLATIKATIKPVNSIQPLTFEDLNYGYGYILYGKKFTQPLNGKLTRKGLRDYATVYVNCERVGVLNRYNKCY